MHMCVSVPMNIVDVVVILAESFNVAIIIQD